MKKAAIFLAQGFEEVEALTQIDLLRRAGVEVTAVSIGEERAVTGSNGITVLADKLFEEIHYEEMDLLILPGGQPGTTNLKGCGKLRKLLEDFYNQNKKLAAICAAPTVFGQLGFLRGRKAACYPGCEDELTGAVLSEEPVAVDGNFITSRGVGTAIPFALSLIEQLEGTGKAEAVRRSIVFGEQ